MTTFLGILLFVAIFVVVVRVITDKRKSTTHTYNSGTGIGGTGNGDIRDGDTGRDEDKFKI